MMFSSTWRRPSSKEFPRVWKTFERTSKDGRMLKLTIQDLPEDRYEDMFELFVQYTEDEPCAVATGLTSDKVGLALFRDYLHEHRLSQNMTIICVLNKEECEERGIKPKIVGLNLVSVKCRGDECDVKKDLESESLKSFYMVSNYFLSCCSNVFEKYNVDKIINSIGLCVDREYRFLGISTEILSVRSLLCKAFNIPVSMNMFTSKGSQRAARNAGFLEECSVYTDQLKKATGINLKTNTDVCKMMILILK